MIKLRLKKQTKKLNDTVEGFLVGYRIIVAALIFVGDKEIK